VPNIAPIAYSPSIEQPAPDEAETIRGLAETMHGIQETTAKDTGHGLRAVHAKGHAIVRGRLTIQADLPPHLAQGIFATPGTHEAIMRFSTIPGDVLDDAVSGPRGLAIKVLDVAGERLPGAEGASSQDFVMANGPVFSAPTPKAFLSNLKLLAATTDRVEGVKKVLSATLQVIDTALGAIGVESATIKTLGGAPNTNPLGETYYSQTPYRYGAHVAKLSIAPVSPALVELAGETVAARNRPDALRETMRETLIEQGGEWELRVQLCTDLDAMPIEDATVLWNEKASPYVAVARLSVDPQISWQHGESDHLEDKLSFSPWHGIAAHRPLGGVNRARRVPYAGSAAFRGDVNRCPIHEPRTLAELDG
jgi:hypothetical protein